MTNQDVFQQRLARIDRGGGFTMKPAAKAPSYKTGRRAQKAAKREAARKRAIAVNPGWWLNIQYPLSFVRAALVGMVAVLAARFARFHLMGGSLTGGADADMMMMLDGGVAVMAGFALKSLFRIEAKELQGAQTLGVIAMVCLMHNLVHMSPNTFSAVFSPEWVQQVTNETEPKSIMFRGMTIPLGGLDPTPVVDPTVTPEEQPIAPELPKIIEIGR